MLHQKGSVCSSVTMNLQDIRAEEAKESCSLLTQTPVKLTGPTHGPPLVSPVTNLLPPSSPKSTWEPGVEG